MQRSMYLVWNEAGEKHGGMSTPGLTGCVELGLDIVILTALVITYCCYHSFSGEDNKAERGSFIPPSNIY